MTEKVHPMRRPEVAAKQSASLRAHYAKMYAMRGKGYAPSKSGVAVERWTPEKRQAQSAKMHAYWNRVRAGLAMLENQHHDD